MAQKNKKGHAGLIIFIIVLILAIGGGAGFYFFRDCGGVGRYLCPLPDSDLYELLYYVYQYCHAD